MYAIKTIPSKSDKNNNFPHAQNDALQPLLVPYISITVRYPKMLWTTFIAFFSRNHLLATTPSNSDEKLKKYVFSTSLTPVI